jgi:hypothetical protein
VELSALGTVVLHPPVALGIWIPVSPGQRVSVTVHEPSGSAGAVGAVGAVGAAGSVDVRTSPDAPGHSLVPVPLTGPRRVWVRPAAELLLDEMRQLQQAAELLTAGAGRDDAHRRGPAHRDPDEWDEGSRLLRTKGSERMEVPMPELGRAWRLGAPVSLAQAVRRRPR